ncbi:hypothetical protein [Streptomyces sp. GC420]|uniref:hypothetical protein n=1 Tax=Streptomyces sp. GC420 TaxID=2697568 RepID=UPI0014152659|nr:hypothetical protein [Streptomyces sp. GC420]NBM14979.1 hypothetical protein [Streptomyces sp. GC420]
MPETVQEAYERIRKTPSFSDSDELRARGFESGSIVYFASPKFTTEDMMAAVFMTKRSAPKTLPIQLSDTAIVNVAVSMVRPVFSEDLATMQELKDEGTPAKEPIYHENPDWYIEGWAVDMKANDGTQPLRVRAYVFSDNPLDEARPGIIEAQIIPQNPDPFGQIGYVRGS